MSAGDEDGPEVRLGAGRVRGRYEGGVAVFRGIPYAAAPVGGLRLAAPAPPEPWDGVRETVAFGPPPPQSRLLATGPAGEEHTDGEWLTVNVWTPGPGAARLPVMVWIYGGGYMFGWSGDPAFDGAVLAGHGVVVVTFNHRVAAEGFGLFDGAPANRGLLDQVAALRWVRDNVAAFGGDPDRVTVLGESAGAGGVAALMAMPGAAGLFHRAVVQSVPNLFLAPELAADIGRAVADVIGVPPHAKELAALPPDWLIEAGDEAAAEMRTNRRWGAPAHIGNPFGPVVDGEVLPRTPWAALADGAARDVELIAGHNRDEYRLFMLLNGDLGEITPGRADAALRLLAPDAEAYRAAHPGADAERLYELVHSDWLFRMPTLRLAEAHHAGGGQTHLYELTWTCPGPAGESLGACHGLGVPLTFGNLGAGTAGTLIGPQPPPDAAGLSARVRAAWTAFAATGDPGWPPYDPERRDTWIIDTEPRVTPYPEETSRRLWAAHPFAPLPLLPDA